MIKKWLKGAIGGRTRTRRWLYLVDVRGELAAESHHLVWRMPGERPRKIPLREVEHILVSRGVSLGSSLFRQCLIEGVGISFLGRYGDFLGGLTPQEDTRRSRRISQYAHRACPRKRLELAKNLVLARIDAMSDRARERGSGVDLDSRKTLIRAVNEACRGIANQCPDLETLRGYEASVTKPYLSLLREEFRHLPLGVRSRRPPRDEVNSLLSYAYAVLSGELRALVQMSGLDPHAGFVHEGSGGRADLVLDLLDILRPGFVDPFLIALVNLKKISRSDFQRDGEGVLLNDEGKRTFFAEWHQWLGRGEESGGWEMLAEYFRELGTSFGKGEAEQLGKMMRSLGTLFAKGGRIGKK